MTGSPQNSSDTIKHWPEDERPRERLLNLGPQALSHAELLAILLRTGIRGKSACALARELLQQFGGLRGLYSVQDTELMQIKGLGMAKIAQLRAAIELSKRYVEEHHKQEKQELDHPQKVFELLRYRKLDGQREEFCLVLLNNHNQLIKIIDAFQGSLSQSAIYPREVIKYALKHAAAAVIFAHNHPSGDPQPSKQDKILTQELLFACQPVGILVLDHVILGDNCYYSFADAGLINEYKQKYENLRK